MREIDPYPLFLWNMVACFFEKLPGVAGVKNPGIEPGFLLSFF